MALKYARGASRLGRIFDTLPYTMFGLFGKKKPVATEKKPVFFFNTATGEKEVFEPLKGNMVSIYSCGPTVYDHIHIGNLRAYLLPDLIKRTLAYNGYKVNHTINFTDFGHLTSDGDEGEDKMMKALKREGKPITLGAMRELAQVYIKSFKEDNEKFRNQPANNYASASNYVKEQIGLVKTLIEKGYAYETSDGVYFEVARFPKYGLLGNIDVSKIKEGARVEANPEKKHPADFALWKKGLLGWESEWGKGFPGWHIECTAMAFATLGKQIDIHTGGEDLKYTHHNGEIAQAESITGKQYVRCWMHNAFVTMDELKLAKSDGSGIRLLQLRDRGFTPEVFRYWLLMTHYRTPANFSFEAMKAAKQALYRLKRHVFEEYKNANGSVNESYRARFHEAINDDLDTPKAIATMWEIVKDTSLSSGEKAATLREIDSVLDIGLSDKSDDAIHELGIIEPEDVPEEIQQLIEEREAARVARNYEEADRLREAINLKGYTLEDTPQGPRVSKA